MSGASEGPPKHLFAGGPYLMGIVNVTPDSFSDGGKFLNPDKAIEQGMRLAREGAAILDVGGESTRPGAHPVDVQEEIERVIPVIEGLKGKAPWLSVDTRNAAMMEAALEAGANIVNDVSALRHDRRSAAVIAAAKVPVILMHMRGKPKNMQKNIIYNSILEDISDFLDERLSFCETNRIDENMVIIDPGIGFGKTAEQNALIIRNISKFQRFGLPLLLGISRKSFIAALSGGEPPADRLPGSLAGALWGLSQGVQIFRVHDVKETAQAFRVYQGITAAAE
jgi:dihydropteroate synthase